MKQIKNHWASKALASSLFFVGYADFEYQLHCISILWMFIPFIYVLCYDVQKFFLFIAIPKVKALVGDFEKISTKQRKEACPSSHLEKTGTCG